MDLTGTIYAPPDAYRDRIRTFVVAVPGTSTGARLFGLLAVPSDAPAADRRTLASFTTTLENIADHTPANDDVREWFTAYLDRLHAACVTMADERLRPISACLAAAWPTPAGVALSIVATGQVTVLRISRTGGVAHTDDIIPPTPRSGPLRFRHALDGSLMPRDALVMGTTAFAEEIPRALIADAIGGAARERDAAYLQRAVRAASGPAAAIAIAGLRPVGERSATTGRRPETLQRPQESMRAFLSTAATTERFLTPSLGPVIRSHVAHVRAALTAARRTRRSRRGSALPMALAGIAITMRTIGLIARTAGAMLIDGIRMLGIGAARGWPIIARLIRRWTTHARTAPPTHAAATPRRRRVVLRLPMRPRAAVTALRERFTALPPSSRWLLGTSIAFGCLFLLSTSALWRVRSRDLRTSSIHATIARVDELRSLAEAKLLFGDAAAARALLVTAVDAIAQARPSRAQRASLGAVDGELRAALDRARTLTRLREPLRVTRAGDPDGLPTIGDITVVGRSLSAVAPDGARFTVINPRDGSAVPIAATPPTELTPPIRMVALDDRALLVIDRRAHAFTVDRATGTVTALTVTEPPSAIADAAVSRNRLYLLLPDGTITRHARTASGFARGEPWLPGDRAVARAERIAVAGTIAITGSDGSAALFLGGQRRPGDLLRNVDPKPQGTLLPAFDATGDTLSLGVPADGRIIVIRTDGTLIGQLQSDALIGMTRIAFDPSGPSLYVLHGTEVSVVVPPKAR